MAAEIKINRDLFQERLQHFLSAWKADKRSGDALFAGASSILVLMGKSDDGVQFQKNNALHVCEVPTALCCWYQLDCVLTRLQFWLLGYEFPATLFLFTLETVYVVTTAKKGESDVLRESPLL